MNEVVLAEIGRW